MTAMLDAIRAHAAADPDGAAIDPCGEPPVSWKRLADLVEARTQELAAAFGNARPVALECDHSADAAVLELALLEAGVPVLSIPSFFTPEQRQHAIQSCGAQAVFAARPLTTAQRTQTAPVPLPRGTARITFTSGSTGTPKGICLSARHMLSVAGSVTEALGSRHAGRHLALLPPGVLLETVAGFFAAMLAGATWLCPPQARAGLENPFRPDFAAMLQTIRETDATSLILVPEYLGGLVAAMEASAARLPLLTLVAVGGARVSPELIERARAVGLPVRQGYGLTECASVVSIEDDGYAAPGSAGRPLSHVQVRIASDGEILIDGPMCLGAVGGEVPVGTLATGDLGRIDLHGRLWIEGRKSSLIVTSYGRNVSPEWVEAALLAQPGIAQAMVYGDGMPLPEALLVPAGPDSDLGAAVAAANAGLPGYAHIGAWHEAAHFTPDNGLLTGNGRLRRNAIAKAYLGGEPAFFTQLEAATVRERLRFMAIPQLQAGLAGAIDRSAYIAYLTQAWHHVRHTVPLLAAARERLAHRTDLAAALGDYVDEETGHDEWILADIAAADGDAQAVRASDPHPATRAMVQHAYEAIAHGNPAALFGMVFVLESVSVAMARRGASAVQQRLGLPGEAFTYLNSHGALDEEHMHFFASLVNGLADPADRGAIVQMARDMFRLYGGVFAAIPLGEPSLEAA